MLRNGTEVFPPHTPTDLQTLCQSIQYFPKDENTSHPLPPSILSDLWDLNLVSLHDILEPHNPTPTCISTKDLSLHYAGKVKAHHKRALNRITQILNSNTPIQHNILKNTPTTPLPPSNRVIASCYTHHFPSPASQDKRFTLTQIWAHHPAPTQTNTDDPTQHNRPRTTKNKRHSEEAPPAHRYSKRGVHTWDVPAFSSSPSSRCYWCSETPTCTMIHCSSCNSSRAHVACHAASTRYPGDWHCPTCLAQPTWEQDRWEVSMAHYNAQRNNDTRLKDHTGRLFSCDLCSTKSPSNMTCWKDYKQYALDPSSPTDPYTLPSTTSRMPQPKSSVDSSPPLQNPTHTKPNARTSRHNNPHNTNSKLQYNGTTHISYSTTSPP